jgi:hypothetical protein
MAQFMGIVRGQRGEASRLGSKSSGLSVTAASWKGAIVVRLYTNHLGVDIFEVTQEEWKGHGTRRAIAEGVVGA